MTPYLVYSGFDLPLSLAIICGIVVCYFIYLTFRPLLEEGDISAEEWERMEDESIALLNRRDRIIEELRDLEFEAGMNKVEGKDLEMLRALYQNEALQVIQELDDQVGRYQDQIQNQVNERLKEAESRRKAKSEKKAMSMSEESAIKESEVKERAEEESTSSQTSESVEEIHTVDEPESQSESSEK